MALGPGKYDDICTSVRNLTKAKGVILVIWDGDKGNGFSAQLPDHPKMPKVIANVLRQVADGIEKGGFDETNNQG